MGVAVLLRRTLLAAALFTAACGKKGPPLAPLNLVPNAPPEVIGRVLADTAVLQFAVPTKNTTGQGPLALDHVEIYAMTLAPGARTLPNRELLTPAHVVGRIEVKPPPDPDAPEEDHAEKDTRPAPGEKVTFVETLTAKQLTPEVRPEPVKASGKAATPEAGETPTAAPETPAPAAPAPGTAAVAGGSATSTIAPAAPSAPPGAAAAPAVPGQAATTPPAAPAAPEKPPTVVTRVYVMRGVSRKGRPGPPSTRVVVPLVPAPAPPAGVTATFSEAAVTIGWKAVEVVQAEKPAAARQPPVEAAPATGEPPSQTPAAPEKPTIRYNVYSAAPGPTPDVTRAANPPVPLNAQPVDALTFEHAGAAPGIAQCFAVRSVETVVNVAIESAPSEPVCVTPRDIFPPSAPKGLAAVSGTGVINLIWDPNPEADVAGYLVLRAESPGDTLQPITPAPLREARYADTAVKPGVRYVYAVIAVDRAEPPNRSAPSNRVEETAR